MPLPKVEVRPVGLRLSGELCGRVYFFKVGTESSATRRAGLEPTVGHRLKANTALRPPAETRTTRSKPVAHSSAGTGKPCLSFSLALLSLLILTRQDVADDDTFAKLSLSANRKLLERLVRCSAIQQ